LTSPENAPAVDDWRRAEKWHPVRTTEEVQCSYPVSHAAKFVSL
jgi:hypothetical protein